MSVNVLGFQTHRDHFAIDIYEKNLRNRISEMRNNNISDQEYEIKYILKNNNCWNIRKARQVLRRDSNWQEKITLCSYRPFDNRSCYFSNAVMDRPRRELLDHVFHKNNLCLLSSRQQGSLGYKHCWIARKPANDCVVSNKSREANQVFPLYLYPQEKEPTLFDTEENRNTPGNRRPNLNQEFINDFAQKLKLKFIPDGKGDRTKTFAPEDIFAYMYAVFHSPTYCDRYSEFLKTDFPRLPLTSQKKLFKQLADLGDCLIEIHLMEDYGEPLTNYPIEGDNKIDKIRYDPPQPSLNKEGEDKLGKVWINKTQYFEGVPQQVWEFYIGGYQVCHKWLKDRKGRTLSYEDLEHYQNIVSAISATIELMDKIDFTINKFGGFPIK